jgi:hypothetical protein
MSDGPGIRLRRLFMGDFLAPPPLRDLDPFRVLLAHDLAIWQRGT